MAKFVILCCFSLIALWSVSVSANGSVECKTICPLVYQPLCATDDSGNTQTFPNDCSRELENCQRKTNFQKTGDGPCP